MRNSPWYIVFLLVLIAGGAGYVRFTSEQLTARVTGKHVETAQGRKRSFELHVVETDKGSFPILQFPIIGYFSGVENVYAGISPGEIVEIRVGQWPPAIIAEGRSYIMSIE